MVSEAAAVSKECVLAWEERRGGLVVEARGALRS